MQLCTHLSLLSAPGFPQAWGQGSSTLLPWGGPAIHGKVRELHSLSSTQGREVNQPTGSGCSQNHGTLILQGQPSQVSSDLGTRVLFWGALKAAPVRRIVFKPNPWTEAQAYPLSARNQGLQDQTFQGDGLSASFRVSCGYPWSVCL